MTIAGKNYVYQGVTDLEVMPLAEVFGTERPEEGTKEYRDWEKQFMRKFADYSSQRAIAFFLLCAFPDLPESIVKYTVRRMPDGTEECKPGRDLRVKLEAKDFEQIVLIISSELKKIEQKLTRKQVPQAESLGAHALKAIVSTQENNSQEIASIVAEVLKQRQPMS